MLPPFNFQKWIEENKESFKPPVGNKMIYKDSTFIVMVVGGPNERQDYHINQTDEWFYQMKGDMVLKIRSLEGEFQDINIREGDIFLLPGGIPHSPQRQANSIGLVVEKTRQQPEKDSFVWYCENCEKVLYSKSFFLENIETQLKEVINNYWQDEKNYTCQNCQTINHKKF